MAQCEPDGQGEQATLNEFTDPDRCTAIAVDTGERCQHPRVPGLRVCHGHAEEEDLAGLATELFAEEELWSEGGREGRSPHLLKRENSHPRPSRKNTQV
jgi:hypothetical protein